MVDVDALDSLHLCLDELRQLLEQEQHVCLVGIATSGLHHLVVTRSLLGEDLVETLRLSLHLSIDSVGLTLCLYASLLGLSFSLDDAALLLNLLGHDDVRLLGLTSNEIQELARDILFGQLRLVYSQIELKVLAHLSRDVNMLHAFNTGTDIHAVTASQIFGVGINNVTPEMRGRAKTVNFGIVYGMGEHSLAKDLRISYPVILPNGFGLHLIHMLYFPPSLSDKSVKKK